MALLTAGLLAEGLSRLVLNPVDYLAVDPVYDSILGFRLEAHAGGHDKWGFRNHEVPESADIVTIGDSQTYGSSAPAHVSWPAQLSAVTHRTVYNLALGGYGPVQYHELLLTRAMQLRPAVVVVGVYYGNDLWDAYTAVYGLRHWGPLRRETVPTAMDSTLVAPPRAVFLAPVRDWLARHSVVYRLFTFTALAGYAREIEFTTQKQAGGVVPFQNPIHGSHTGFTPRLRLKALDLQDSTIEEGLRLSLDRLERMAEECAAAGVRFLVALIPTKERVHAPWLSTRGDLQEHETFRELFQNEYEADRRVRQRLARLGIRYLDLEGPLREASAIRAVYPANQDGHPNSDGYAVIAEAVAKAIRAWLRDV